MATDENGGELSEGELEEGELLSSDEEATSADKQVCVCACIYCIMIRRLPCMVHGSCVLFLVTIAFGMCLLQTFTINLSD